MDVLVVGASSTSIRLADELVRGGVRVVVLAKEDSPDWMLDELRLVGARVQLTATFRDDDLRAAGIKQCRAVVVIGLDEMATVRLALMVEELNPTARIVLELDNPAFGRRLEPLLGNCTALSAAELAAPAFVAAAFSGGLAQPVSIAGRRLAAGRDSRVGGEVLAVLGDVRADEVNLTLPDQGNVVLASKVISSGPRVRQSGWWGAFVSLFDRRLRWVIGILLALVFVSTLFFHFAGGIDWVGSLYIALTASTLTSMGEDFSNLGVGTRLVGIAIQLAGLVITSGITAVIVDALISSRLGSLTGGLLGRPNKHYVVVGLGRVGRRVARQLAERGLSVVALERSEDAVGVASVRALGIPVIIGEASDDEMLRKAGVERAECLVTVTDSDAANLQVALAARAVNPALRVVTRMFDDDLAARVERQLDTGPTRSVSRLAAPSFAAAALGRQAETVVSVGRRVVILAEVDAHARVTVAELERAAESRVLAVRRHGSWNWAPGHASVVEPGDRVAVAATRAGMARVDQTLAGAAAHRRD